MNKISWGILITSNFAQNVIFPSVSNCVNSEFTGIASRNPDSAEETAKKPGIPKSYGLYEELLTDESIDAVANMKVIDAVFNSAQTGGSVSV